MHSSNKVLKLSLIILYCIIFISNIGYMLLSILSICIHEISHIFFVKFVDIKEIKISILGFRMDLDYGQFINKEIFVYLAGSFVNILVGILCLAVSSICGIDMLYKFMAVNFVIGFINLVPAFPLDGAIVFKNILFRKFRQNTASFISIFVSLIMAIIIFVLSIVLILKFSFLSVSYMIIAILIFVSTYREYRLFLSTFIVNKIDYKKYLFLKKRYVKTVVLSVSCDVKLLELIKLYKFSRFLVFCFLNDELQIIGIMNEYNVLECYKKFGNIEIREYYRN